MNYTETDCTITREGRVYSAGGAVVSADVIVAYTAAGGILTDWHGRPIGTWRATRTWRTPRSWVSSAMSQIWAKVDGVTYTGRGAGVGMIYRGRRAK